MIEGFLLGIIATSSVMAGIFFLKFWKHTRDFLFIAFAVAFIIEGFSRASVLLLAKPNEGSPVIYVVRLLASLLILFAILKKNYGTRNPSSFDPEFGADKEPDSARGQ